jgi:hypothetical protein
MRSQVICSLPFQKIIHCKPHHVYRKTQFMKWQGYECTYLRWVNQHRVTMVFKMTHPSQLEIKK